MVILLTLITATASAFPGQRHHRAADRAGHLAGLRPARHQPGAFLIAEVFASNLGGAATLIGDPPNIIIASRSGLRFPGAPGAAGGDRADRLHAGDPVVVQGVVRRRSGAGGERDDAGRAGAIVDPRLLAAELGKVTEGDALLAVMLVLLVSAILSGIIDNIPYVATMSPVVLELTKGIPDPGQAEALWWALATGADFGGKRDHHRRERERGGDRPGAPGRVSDHALGVHPQGPGDDRDHDRGRRAPTSGSGTSSSPDAWWGQLAGAPGLLVVNS